MLYLLLAEEGEAASTGNDWTQWVMLIVILALLVFFFVWSSRRNKKQQQESQNLINAVKPGNKVKTIGGICGIVVEVNDDENTFILETGSESSGKCYMKFDKQAIYQTDAVVEKDKGKAETQKKEQTETEEETQAPANGEETSEEPKTEN